MQQPPGFADARYPSHVCKLQRALYGLKQSPRAWYARLSSRLLQLGFVPSRANASLFFFRHQDVQIYMLVYVDDIVIAGSSPLQSTVLFIHLRPPFLSRILGRWSTFLAWKRRTIQGG